MPPSLPCATGCASCKTQTATEQRRLVTILFADLVDFTVLTRRLDAEDVREVVNEYFARWTSAIERHGGVVEKFAGDAVMAVFGLLAIHRPGSHPGCARRLGHGARAGPAQRSP